MGPDTSGFLEPALGDSANYDAIMAEMCSAYAGLTAESLTAELNEGDWPANDVTAMKDPAFATYLTASLRKAVTPGPQGWQDDSRALVSPWGFDVGGISIPMAIWYGQADPDVPPAHSKWLASKVGTAVEHSEADEGHLSVFWKNLDPILDDLLDLAGNPNGK